MDHEEFIDMIRKDIQKLFRLKKPRTTKEMKILINNVIKKIDNHIKNNAFNAIANSKLEKCTGKTFHMNAKNNSLVDPRTKAAVMNEQISMDGNESVSMKG